MDESCGRVCWDILLSKQAAVWCNKNVYTTCKMQKRKRVFSFFKKLNHASTDPAFFTPGWGCGSIAGITPYTHRNIIIERDHVTPLLVFDLAVCSTSAFKVLPKSRITCTPAYAFVLSLKQKVK